MCRYPSTFITVAYFAAAATSISAATSHGRKVSPRAMSWLPNSSMFFDFGCLVTKRLRSDPAKATIRAIVCVTMASKVRHGDLRNILWPSERKPDLPRNRRQQVSSILLSNSDLQ